MAQPDHQDYSPAPFDGRRFHNLGAPGQRSRWALLRWILTRKRGEWPAHIEPPASPLPVAQVGAERIRATVVGHSTVLIQHNGLNLLTDPVWSSWIGPTSWIGVRRVQGPALSFNHLPMIDVVLLSHNHYDHLDRPTLARLVRRDRPRVLTGLGVSSALSEGRLEELNWWETAKLPNGDTATYVPARHFSARGLFDRNKSLWGGFVIESPRARIYFAGDTAIGSHFDAIRRKFGPMDLSLIPIGAYAPRWMMAQSHVNPAEALAASKILESQLSMAIHYGAFRLADDSFAEPVEALRRAIAESEDRGARGMDFRAPPFGRAVEVKL